MKRLLTILIALCVGSSAFGALTYTTKITSDVKVTDQSTKWYNQYLLEFTQTGHGSSDGKDYDTSVYLIIYPDEASIAGTFSIADGSIDPNSYIKYGSNYRYMVDYNAEKTTAITITDNGNGTYSMEGWLRGKQGSNSYYYYEYAAKDNVFKVAMPDPYTDEGATKNFTVEAADIRAYDYRTSNGFVELDLNSEKAECVALAFYMDDFNIPAGTYQVSESGSKGTIKVSGGMDGYYADMSYFMSADWDYYFITGGSITIGYSNGNMTVSGEFTSGHGSTIAVSGSAKSPFETSEPEPETYTLSVSSITTTVTDKYFDLQIRSTLDGDPCNCFIRINSETLVGNYDYQSFYTWCKAGDWYLDTTSTGHTLSIAKTANENEYKLNFTIYCEDGNIYKVVDAIFTYVPPTPFDLEPEASKFSFTLEATPEVFIIDGTTVLSFRNSSFDELAIAFPVSSADKIVAGTYNIATTKEEGTVIASSGCIDDVYQPTYIAIGAGILDSDPYFLTEGSVSVAFSEGKIVLTGTVLSAKGSEITLNVSGTSPVEEPELPDNAFAGYLLGTGMNYFICYDVTTNGDHTVTVAATLVLDEPVLGLQPQVVIGDSKFDMSYDEESGACEYTTTATYTKGTELEIHFNLARSSRDVATKSFKYSVEQ